MAGRRVFGGINCKGGMLLARRFGVWKERRDGTCFVQKCGLPTNLLPNRSHGFYQSSGKRNTWKSKGSNIVAFAGAGAMGLLGMAGSAYADEAEHGLAAPSYPWANDGWFASYDHAAIRRGHQVYKEVCAACHAMSLIAYRDLIGVAYTELEVKALAAEIEVEDGPNDDGEMFGRPGKPADHLQPPYANEQAARSANGGAYPPDLSLICKARHNGPNYVFALLTGYRDAPAGISVRQGLYYNPYFPGGAIAMPRVINDGGVEFEDGTPATSSQMAKDVTHYLAWAAEPEHDERKLIGAKWICGALLCLYAMGYYKRWKWGPLKSRRIIWDVVN
ncbi:hypothetical protein M758_3G241600 [Ceratodon purpureus]|nr:hypothetical protein M758_3G241600 [Ceratodon purpureus]